MEQPTAEAPVSVNRRPRRAERFVNAVFAACKRDTGIAARLRRADNPATEYQSWDFLVAHGVDLEKPWERKPFALIAAAIARSEAQGNGTASFGQALASCYDYSQREGPGAARMRRALACSSIEEVVQVLRPMLTLIQSKQKQSLDYAKLLEQLQWFNDRTRAQWAQEYYRRSPNESTNTQQEGAA